MNELKSIVDVDIEIQSPTPPVGPADCVLIVGLPPVADPPSPPPEVAEYRTMTEVVAAGFDGNDPIAVAAKIAFQQNPRPDKVIVAIRQEGGQSALEPITDTLDRALEMPGWYIVCPAGIGPEEFEAIAGWTEDKEKLFAYTFLTAADPVPDTFFRSHGWCGRLRDGSIIGELPIECAYVHVAVCVKCLSYEAGSESWAYKQVLGFPRFALSDTFRGELVDSNAIINVTGRNYSANGKTRGGEWIDIMRGRDWLQNEMRTRIFNVFAKEPKVAYTDAGIAKIQNEVIASLKAAQERSIIQADEWDESGEPVPGFTVDVPSAGEVGEFVRSKRKLNVSFRAKLVGAIHFVEIRGVVSY